MSKHMSENEMIKYFSEDFDIIPLHDAKELLKDGSLAVLILAPDGTDRYIDDDCTEELLEKEYSNGCMFGLERL